MEHSILSPSSAHRWLICPGSLARCKNYKSKTSVYADEGNLAHSLAAAILRNEKEPDNIPIDMHEPVEEYVLTIDSLRAGAEHVWIEETLDTSNVLSVPDQKGTGDCIILQPAELIVNDLKYGKGVKVFAKRNWQLIIYALAALEQALWISDSIKRVRLIIHQPRLGHVDECVYTTEELLEFGEFIKVQTAKVMKIYESGKIPESALVPGKKQCRFCPAKGDCKELQNFCLSKTSDCARIG
jgi:hypothetical protein